MNSSQVFRSFISYTCWYVCLCKFSVMSKKRDAKRYLFSGDNISTMDATSVRKLRQIQGFLVFRTMALLFCANIEFKLQILSLDFTNFMVT